MAADDHRDGPPGPEPPPDVGLTAAQTDGLGQIIEALQSRAAPQTIRQRVCDVIFDVLGAMPQLLPPNSGPPQGNGLLLPLRAWATDGGHLFIPGSWPASDANWLAMLADLLATAEAYFDDVERLEQAVLVDEHSGLFNARHLRSHLAREARRAQRFGHPLSVLFIDLDHFKEVNDAHGHQAGSALLSEFGELLRGLTRDSDVAFRYGGDEFVVVLAETDMDGALHTAERFRDELGRHEFLRSRGIQAKVTASIGTASLPDDGNDAESLLHSADLALYAAKDRGRNAVVSTRDLPKGEPDDAN